MATNRQFLTILTSKHSSRHNRIRFFDILTSKVVRPCSVFNMLTWACASCHNGVHFFDTSTQLPKWSEAGVFCTFWLGNVLRATRACNFSIFHLASWLRTRHFSKPTFRPAGATKHWKNTVSPNFPTFLHNCIFFLLTFSSLIFFFFSSLHFSDFLFWLSSLLFICPYCQMFDLKLPSNMFIHWLGFQNNCLPGGCMVLDGMQHYVCR